MHTYCKCGFSFTITRSHLCTHSIWKKKKKKPFSPKSYTQNDETLLPSDRFLLILSFSGGARGVISPSSSIKLPPSQPPPHQAHAEHRPLFHRTPFFFSPLSTLKTATGCGVGSPSGERNYKEDRVETLWRAHEGAATSGAEWNVWEAIMFCGTLARIQTPSLRDF